AGHLQPHEHHPLQQLALQHVAWRQLLGVAGVLAEDVALGTVEFTLQDHVLIDDRSDAVDRLQLLRVQWLDEARRGRNSGNGKEAGEQIVHGVMSGELSSTSPLRTSGGGTRERSSR